MCTWYKRVVTPDKIGEHMGPPVFSPKQGISTLATRVTHVRCWVVSRHQFSTVMIRLFEQDKQSIAKSMHGIDDLHIKLPSYGSDEAHEWLAWVHGSRGPVR